MSASDGMRYCRAPCPPRSPGGVSRFRSNRSPSLLSSPCPAPPEAARDLRAAPRDARVPHRMLSLLLVTMLAVSALMAPAPALAEGTGRSTLSDAPPALGVRLGRVVYVNMDVDLENREKMETMISASRMLGPLPRQRIPAVVGKQIDLHEHLYEGRIGKEGYNHIVSNRVVGGERMTAGALGCLESHVISWRIAAELNQPLLVFEDDIAFTPDFDDRLQELLEHLPTDFGMAYLTNLIGAPIQHALTDFNEHWSRMNGEHWGTYTYMVSPHAARKLLQHVYPADMQVDSIIIRTCQHYSIPVYMSKFNIIKVDNSFNRKTHVQRYKEAPFYIPRILHFVWLGNKPMPLHLFANRMKWQAMHPGWRVMLWTDATLPPLVNRRRFDTATLPAQKADIVRYEVVLRHGGVFIDLDFEPLKNLETILGGLQGFVSYESRFWICNGIFGSVADYPLMRALVYDLDSNWERYKDGTVNQQTGPHYITKLVKSMALPDFRAFTRHIFFPYEWNQDDPGVYDDYSYAVHHFDKVNSWNA